MVTSLISNPNGFFEKLKEKEISLKIPIVIILVLSVLGGITQFLFMNKMAEAFPAEISGFLRLGAYFGFVGSFATMLIIWVVFSGIMHIISSFLGGQGLFKRTLEFTGYGFVPLVIASAITTPIGAQYISSARVPNFSMADIQSGEFVNEFMSSMMPADYVYFSIMITLAFGVWSLMLWTFGIKNARELSVRDAAITALIPFLAYVSYTAYSLWGML